jgi:hypothetical protein
MRNLINSSCSKFLSDYIPVCVYIRRDLGSIEIITVWVDNLLLFTNQPDLMITLKQELQELFKVIDLGDPFKIVRIEIGRDWTNKSITITQTQYINSILEKYGLQNANSVGMPLNPGVKLEASDQDTEKGNRSNPYSSLIGSLMYTTIATRPDMAFAVFCLASFMANPDLNHWATPKHVLRYLAGTRNYGITYKACETQSNNFIAYADANFVNNNDQISISGYLFLLSGGAITWSSKKQNAVMLSTAEAKYTALAYATKEAIWL